MALTPEDVVNKRFNPTKFREGYDQDEVDDFLDEVVVELRRLNQENEELRQRLMAADSRINELQAGVAAAAPAAAPAPVAAPEPAFAPQAVAGDPSDPANTNNLLQLARRLHEEHVREGMEKRDALIAEGHATAARVVSEAEQAQRAQLGKLEQERTALERQIDELRTFEREYRIKLKGYIEGQLRELESSNALTSGSSAPAAVTAGPSAQQAPQQQAPQQQAGEQAAQEQPGAPAQQPQAAPAPQQAAPQQFPAPQPAPAYNGPQPSDFSAYPQPGEAASATPAGPSNYPGFAQGN
jgi:DivIVA domain-containing protein